jgi:hypothetical protein
MHLGQSILLVLKYIVKLERTSATLDLVDDGVVDEDTELFRSSFPGAISQNNTKIPS